jgi:probable HAF family extracellular repeat protein
MCSDDDDDVPGNAAAGEAGESASSAGTAAGGASSAGGANPSGAPGHAPGGGGATAEGGAGAAGEAGAPAQRCQVELAPSCLGPIDGSGGQAGVAVISAVAAFLGEGVGVTDLNGVNDYGQIAGSMTCDSTIHAFVSADGKIHDLLNGSGDLSSEATDVNNQGVVIGNVAFDFDEERHNYRPIFPFIWEGGETLVLRDLPDAQAVAINDQGQVLLRADGGAALVWDDGVVTELGPQASGADINDLGQVVGTLGTDAGTSVGFVWEAGVMTELPELRAALAINDSGQIVGTSSADGKPVLLDGGELTELAVQGVPLEITNNGKVLATNSVLSDGVLSQLSGRLRREVFEGAEGTDINEAGLIVGVGEVLRFVNVGGGCRLETCEDWESYPAIWSPGCYDSCCGEGAGGAGGAGGQAGQ